MLDKQQFATDEISAAREEIGIAERYFTEPAIDRCMPEHGRPARTARTLLESEMLLDGDPGKNLATFVTTWMEPEARDVIAANLHRNYIDHAEYPQTAEISKRCVRMLHELFHGDGEPDAPGAACAGSSEAVMLGALAMKWRWKATREKAGKSVDQPNLVYGADVHVVWDKFCRYFDVEPRQVPLARGSYTVSADEMEPHIDENTIGVVAVVGTTFTGDCDDVAGIDRLLADLRVGGLDVPLHIDAASGGFVFPFSHPDFEWDFRLPSVKSINVSGHKFGLVYPGVGWLVFRDDKQLPEDLVFYEDYLGQVDATFTLNFSGSSAFILAQYYQFIRLARPATPRWCAHGRQRDDARHGACRHGRHRADRGRAAVAARDLAGARGRAVHWHRAGGRAGAAPRLDGAGLQAAAQQRGPADHADAREVQPDA